MRYLRSECHLAENTVLAYDRDLRRFFAWLAGRRIEGLSISELAGYPAWLTAQELAPASIGRHVVSLKVFFRYLQLEGVLTDNQAELLGTQKLWQRVPTVLSPDEIDALLTAPQAAAALVAARPGDARIALRHRLPRVGAFEAARPRDVHLDERYCLCHGKGDKQRIVPLGKQAVAAVEAYLQHERPKLRGARSHAVAVPAALVARRPAAARADLGAGQALRASRPAAPTNQPALAAAQLRHAPAGRRRRPAASAGNARPRQHRHDADLHARRPHAAQEGPRRRFIRGREDSEEQGARSRGVRRAARALAPCSCSPLLSSAA